MEASTPANGTKRPRKEKAKAPKSGLMAVSLKGGGRMTCYMDWADSSRQI